MANWMIRSANSPSPLAVMLGASVPPSYTRAMASRCSLMSGHLIYPALLYCLAWLRRAAAVATEFADLQTAGQQAVAQLPQFIVDQLQGSGLLGPELAADPALVQAGDGLQRVQP